MNRLAMHRIREAVRLATAGLPQCPTQPTLTWRSDGLVEIQQGCRLSGRTGRLQPQYRRNGPSADSCGAERDAPHKVERIQSGR